VQRVAAGAAAEHQAQRLEPGHGEQHPAGQPDRLGGQQPGDLPGHLHVLRVALVVLAVLRRDRRIGPQVDVVGGGVQAGQPAGDERLAHPLGRAGQVGHGAEAAEALAEHAPRRAAGDLAADQLRVGDDRVGPEAGQVLGLVPRGAQAGQGLAAGRRRPPGAALVEQQHPVVRAARGPATRRGRPAAARRARGRPPGTAARAARRPQCRPRRSRGRIPRSAGRPAPRDPAGRRTCGR